MIWRTTGCEQLAGGVLTLDALHTQRATAEAIVTDHHAAYVLAVKANQANLLAAVAPRFTQPNAVFQDAGRYATDLNTAHGRVERRDIRTAPAEGIDRSRHLPVRTSGFASRITARAGDDKLEDRAEASDKYASI